MSTVKLFRKFTRKFIRATYIHTSFSSLSFAFFSRNQVHSGTRNLDDSGRISLVCKRVQGTRSALASPWHISVGSHRPASLHRVIIALLLVGCMQDKQSLLRDTYTHREILRYRGIWAFPPLPMYLPFSRLSNASRYEAFRFPYFRVVNYQRAVITDITFHIEWTLSPRTVHAILYPYKTGVCRKTIHFFKNHLLVISGNFQKKEVKDSLSLSFFA